MSMCSSAVEEPGLAHLLTRHQPRRLATGTLPHVRLRQPQLIAVLAAVSAIALTAAPFLDYVTGTTRLAQFASDQPEGFWFGRAAVLLLVLAACAVFRRPLIAAVCAVAAVVLLAMAGLLEGLRQGTLAHCAGFIGLTCRPPSFEASPQWGLRLLIAVAIVCAAALVHDVVSISVAAPLEGPRLMAAGALALAAVVASFAPGFHLPGSLGGPRRYVDYLQSPDWQTVSLWHGHFIGTGVVLIVLAAACARLPRVAAALSLIAFALITAAGVAPAIVGVGWRRPASGYWALLLIAGAMVALTVHRNRSAPPGSADHPQQPWLSAR